MSPEYGATCTIFPIDQVTLDYLRFTGRDEEHVALVEAYAKAQGLWHDPGAPEPVLLRGRRARPRPPSSPARRPVPAPGPGLAGRGRRRLPDRPGPLTAQSRRRQPGRRHHRPRSADGHVVIAAITSCTNTSNPQVMVAAGLLAQQRRRPRAALQALGEDLARPRLPGGHGLPRPRRARRAPARIGFYLVGYGCTTCIGNSGPLLAGVSEAVKEGDLSVAAVLSGNRNFEGRIHPDVRMNYLASPPLVVAYALAGTIGHRPHQRPARPRRRRAARSLLSELWPSMDEVSRHHPHLAHLGHVPRPLQRRLRRRRVLARGPDRRRGDVRLAGRLDLREEPPASSRA